MIFWKEGPHGPYEIPFEEWAPWFNSGEDRQIALTKIVGWLVDLEVSTVFISFDPHYPHLQRKPHLYETVIFSPKTALATWRYITRAAAQHGHDRVVEYLRAGVLDERELYALELAPE